MIRRSWTVPVVVVAMTLTAVALAANPPAAPKTTEIGRGPTLVMIHGLGSGRMAWMPTVRKLVGTHRVVLVDLPGHGDTPLPDPFNLQVAAEAIAQVLAAQKAESTIVVGQGYGGVLAVMAVAAHPERARGVALIDVALRFEPRIPEQQQRAFIQALDSNYDFMLRTLFGRMGRDSAQGVLIHAQAVQVAPATIKAYLREALNFDGSGALKAVKAPVLYIGSERIWADSLDWAAVAKQRGFEGAAGVTSRRIDDSGLLIATEQPDSLAAVLADFSSRALRTKK